MKKLSWPLLIALGIALALGVGLHFLFQWLPNPITALVSPVRESLWEHVKILALPLLLAGLILSRHCPEQRTGWLLSVLVVTALMLVVSYVYHFPLEGESMIFDIGLYVVLMVVGFLLPPLLAPLASKPIISWLAFLGVAALVWAMVWFTFFPPDRALFWDLSRGVPTFYTIPV